MATITPPSVTLEPLDEQTFTTDISTPVWTLHGDGTLNQSGEYVAPSSTSDTIIVEAATDFWATVNGSKFTLNDDDSLTVTANGSGFTDAKAYLQLAATGDFVEIEVWEDNPFWICYSNSGQSKFFGLYNGNCFERVSGVDTNHGAVATVAGDKIKIRLNASGKFEFFKNGSLLHTSTNTITGVDFYIGLSASTTVSTVIKKPLAGGAGITGYTFAQAVVTLLLPLLLPRRDDLELYCEAELLDLTDGANVKSFTDQSEFARHLETTAHYPTFETNEINGQAVVRWDGSKNPLRNTDSFTVACGWVVAKFADAEFSYFQGILTDLTNQSILVSSDSGTNFFDVGYDLFEFRSNERIYPASAAPAPMEEFAVIFFRFWRPIVVDGIQLGRQTTFSGRKFDGDIALVALYSGGFCESEIQTYTQSLAEHFDLDLADVYPFVPDRDSTETSAQSVNFYDPPEGERISEALDDHKRAFQCKFTSRRRDEVKMMKTFHTSHYAPALACLLRNYNLLPPEDIEGYIDSPYQLNGSNNNYSYGFDFKEK